jgi:hypothetical protein
MNCPFCQSTLAQFDSPNESLILIHLKATSHKCLSCDYTFIYEYDGKLIRWFFDYNDYRMSFWVHGTKFLLIKLFPINMRSWEIILNLDHHPNITPQNVKKKLPTLLTFL